MNNPKKIDLSIIILNFNTNVYLERLLDSLKKAKTDNYKIETIVVDNASKDDSLQMLKTKFPRIQVIANKKNLGFSQGINQGIRKARGENILILNSDTLIFKDTLVAMISFMGNHRNFAAATCRLELKDGILDSSCHRGFPTPWAALTYFLGL